MPPRERAARERQLRQEAAEARRIAEAEAEAAKEAVKNGGVLRRKPAGGHAEGTLAARNAANILAQLLGARSDSALSISSEATPKSARIFHLLYSYTLWL